MKKLIIISIAFFLSLPIAAQRTVKASSPLELLHKIDRKAYTRGYYKGLPKVLQKVRMQMTSEINEVFLADTIFVISHRNYDEVDYRELIWSKNDSIEYTYQLFNEKIYKRTSNYSETRHILKLIKENKPLPNPLKEYDKYHYPITVIKIVRKKSNIYTYSIHATHYYDNPANWLHEHEQDLFSK